ncbi:UNVERIFIED_CONTAM: Thioredoxin domain-containing protein 9 [Sesamum calycinum]|uniref:Thioredoxin domain-containing protein 9 n=1 Tax=Sesamum calycinum TaxID=2727403 RepID=A0AAW2PLZ5_9LAMI
MDNPKVQEILEKQVLTVAKAVEDKIDEEISALERLDMDDLEVLRERRLQQMKKMAEKRSRWIALGHGEYTEIPNEKDFFSIVKASERVIQKELEEVGLKATGSIIYAGWNHHIVCITQIPRSRSRKAVRQVVVIHLDSATRLLIGWQSAADFMDQD